MFVPVFCASDLETYDSSCKIPEYYCHRESNNVSNTFCKIEQEEGIPGKSTHEGKSIETDAPDTVRDVANVGVSARTTWGLGSQQTLRRRQDLARYNRFSTM